MAFQQSKINKAELIALLQEEHAREQPASDTDVGEHIEMFADDSLSMGIVELPVYHYFEDIEGKHYVLEDDEAANNVSCVYESTSKQKCRLAACKEVLQSKIASLGADGAKYENLSGLVALVDF